MDEGLKIEQSSFKIEFQQNEEIHEIFESSLSVIFKLKKYAVSCIASQIPSKDIQILGDLFEQVDIDHDGFITTS